MASAHPETPEDRLPRIVTTLPGPRAQAVLDLDSQWVSPSYTRGYPFVAERGEGALVWDVDGNRFLDFNAGIAVTSTGHCHPEVVKVVQEQAARLIHMSGTDFYYRAQAETAKAVCEIVPIPGPKRAFLSNSGTEAIECAMKLARYHTGRRTFISFYGAFHGRTYGALSLTQSKVIHKRRMGPFVPDVIPAPFPYTYRAVGGRTEAECVKDCLDHIEKIVFGKQVSPEDVAAVFIEPIQGEGGYVPAPRAFLEGLRDLTQKHGIMLVFDEVQSGMGRTGKWFASEHAGVVADIYCIAKGVASGLPLGVTVASHKVMDWPSGAHANTFGGNPLACVAALKTIELLRGGLIDNAAVQGRRLIEGLKGLLPASRILGDVRGVGLMVGVEVVRDRQGKGPAPDLRDLIIDRCFHRGLLLLGCGPNTVRFSPPLVVDSGQVDWTLATFRDVVAEIEEGGGSAT